MSVNNLLTFEGGSAPTTNSPIVRDDEKILVSAKRSRNAMPDPEWEIRGYEVRGLDITFSVNSVEQADLAAVLLEEFDGGDLTRYGSSNTSLRKGVPVAVATDGKPAIAAWLRIRDYSREEIAELLSVGERTVVEYLSRFRGRGTGIPDHVDAPEVGSLVPELPPSMDYSRGDEE